MNTNNMYYLYQMNGITLYFTFFLYSKYPLSPSSNTFSSFLILFDIITGYIRKIKNENSEPSTNGIDKNNKIVYKYIGCLIIEYNPVSITF